MSKRVIISLSLSLVFIAFIAMLSLGLGGDPNKMTFKVKDSTIVDFALPSLTDQSIITNADLRGEKGYYVLNFWGSWCSSCVEEHPFIRHLSRTETVYGINWLDDKAQALRFLRKLGNPYRAILVDEQSTLAISLGVSGAPETYLVSNDGTIIHRFQGVLNQGAWQREFVPFIDRLQGGK